MIFGRRRGRVRTPTILQAEAAECGAASLAMVLAFHGCPVSVEQLRADCDVPRNGSNPGNLVRVARQYGLKAQGLRVGPEQIKQYPSPSILFWKYNHFLVVEGSSRQGLHVNDPSLGRHFVPWKEVRAHYTGVMLTFEKGPGFQTSRNSEANAKSIKSKVGEFWLELAFIALATVLLFVPGMVSYASIKVFIDFILIDGQHQWVSSLLGLMTLSALLAMTITWIQQRAILNFMTKKAVWTSTRFFQHLYRIPSRFLGKRSVGELAHPIQCYDHLASQWASVHVTCMVGTLISVFYGTLLLLINVQIASVVIFLAVFEVLLFWRMAIIYSNTGPNTLKSHGKFAGLAINGIRSMESLKTMGGENTIFGRLADLNAQAGSATQNLGSALVSLQAVPVLINWLAIALVVGVGGPQVLRGTITLGDFFALLVLARFFLYPFKQLISIGPQILESQRNQLRLDNLLTASVKDEKIFPAQSIRTAIDEDDDEIDIHDDTLEGSSNISPRGPEVEFSGALILHEVTFGYNTLSAPLIEGMSLTLPAGHRVAVVGRSGSGKSTLGKLAAGLLTPWSGRILLDHQPIETIDAKILARNRAFIDQRLHFFAGTIAENICLWDESIPMENIIQAAKDACIYNDILKRGPNAFEGPVYDHGANFSGGQRQRLEIARALVHCPNLIVLDEATSGLDPMLEKRIDENLRRRGCTCLIIAHRLSTIRDCDEIIVLDQGRIQERGTHHQLLQRDGYYRSLVQNPEELS